MKKSLKIFLFLIISICFIKNVCIATNEEINQEEIISNQKEELRHN